MQPGARNRPRATTCRASAVGPLDVVEAAVDVTAFLPGRALVAELGPHGLAVVETELRLVEHVGEERRALELFHRRQLPVRADGGELAPGSRVELRQPFVNARLQLGR